MRIGVLGGSFDPPHLGHLALAQCALNKLKLDLVLFVPAFQQWQKNHHADADTRKRLVAAAIAGYPNFQLSEVDFARGANTYTAETYLDLQKQFPDSELFFIIGSDAVAGLPSWKYPEVLRKIQFVSALRPGETSQQIPDGFSVQWLDCLLPNVSSSLVRDLLDDPGDKSVAERLNGLVPESVISQTELLKVYK